MIPASRPSANGTPRIFGWDNNEVTVTVTCTTTGSFATAGIYTNLTGNETTPTVQAWGIQTEPWLFGVDASGTVVLRIDGAFGHDEQQQLLQQLVS